MYPFKNRKPLMVFSLSLSLLLGTASFVCADAPSSRLNSHWAQESLERWLADGFIDPALQPQEAVTSRELHTLLETLCGIGWDPDPSGNAPVDRQAALQLLWPLMEAAGPGDLRLLESFSDAQDIDPENRAAICHFIEQEILFGYPDQTLRPNSPISHEEFLALLDRIFIQSFHSPGHYRYTQATAGAVTACGGNITLNDSFFKGPMFLTGNLSAGPMTLKHVTSTGTAHVSTWGDQALLLNGDYRQVTLCACEHPLSPVILSGTFGEVSTASGVDLTIQSGSVLDSLLISSDSTILLEKGAQITSLTVHAPCTLRGEGTIVELQVESPGVTIRPAVERLFLGSRLLAQKSDGILTILPKPKTRHAQVSRESTPSPESFISLDLTPLSDDHCTDRPSRLDLDLMIDPSSPLDCQHVQVRFALLESPTGSHPHLLADEWTDLLQAGYWPGLEGFAIDPGDALSVPLDFRTDLAGSYTLEVRLIDMDQKDKTIGRKILSLQVSDLMQIIASDTTLTFPSSLTGFEGDVISGNLQITYPGMAESVPADWAVDTLITRVDGQAFAPQSSLTCDGDTCYIDSGELHALFLSQISDELPLLKEAQNSQSALSFSGLPVGSYDVMLQQVASCDAFNSYRILSETTCHIEVEAPCPSTYRLVSDLADHHFTVFEAESFTLTLLTDRLGSRGYDAAFFLFDSLSQPESSVYHLKTDDLTDLTVMPAIGLASPFTIETDASLDLTLTFDSDTAGSYCFRLSLMNAQVFNQALCSEIFSITVLPADGH